MNTYRLVPLGDCTLEQYREIPDDQLFSVLNHSHFRDKTKTWSFVPEEWDIEKGGKKEFEDSNPSDDEPSDKSTKQISRKSKDESLETTRFPNEFTAEPLGKSLEQSLKQVDQQVDKQVEQQVEQPDESTAEITMIEKSSEKSLEEPVKSAKSVKSPKSPKSVKSPKQRLSRRKARKIAEPFPKSKTPSPDDSDKLEEELEELESSDSNHPHPISQSYQFPSDHQLESPGLRKRQKNSLQKSNNIVQVNVQKLRGGSIMDLRQIYDQAQLIQATERPDHESDSDSEADLDNAVKQLAEDDNDNWIQGCGCQLNLNSLITITQILIGGTIIVFCVYKLVVDTSSDSQSTYVGLLSLVVGAFLPGRIDGSSQ